MNESSAAPLYRQVKEDMKRRIQNGIYKPKDKIPSEPELSAEYAVSRITIRRAVEELCTEGYLVKQQGRGTFVMTPRIHRKITERTHLESFSKTCENAGLKAGARLLERKIVPAGEPEREFLRLEKDALLLHVERIRTADGYPVFLENLYFPYEPYRALMTENLDDVSAFQVIGKIHGKQVADTARRTLESVRATAEQAEKLGIPAGEPLLYLDCYFVDGDGTPLCIGRQYYIGSRYMFEL